MTNPNEIRFAVKVPAAQKFIDQNPECFAVVSDDYTYVIPYEVDGNTYYAKWSLVVAPWADAKNRSAFNVETDVMDAQTALDMLIERQEEKKRSSEAKKKK